MPNSLIGGETLSGVKPPTGKACRGCRCRMWVTLDLQTERGLRASLTKRSMYALRHIQLTSR